MSLSLKKLDQNTVSRNQSNEIILFSLIRNEYSRLPFFLSYYQKLGVDRFFFIDNASTDESVSFLLKQKNKKLHVFRYGGSYDRFIKQYYESFIKKHGLNKWCLIVDPDETLRYPLDNFVNLKQLCTYLDQKKLNAMECILLDMYSDRKIIDTGCKIGQNPIKTCCFFDASTISHNGVVFMGGVRKRVFQLEEVVLTKYPLLKVNEKMTTFEGFHNVKGIKSGKLRGVLFHFKFLNLFPAKVVEEVNREEHWRKAFEYKEYVKKDLNSLNLYSARYSKKFKNLFQLYQLKIINFPINYLLFSFYKK